LVAQVFELKNEAAGDSCMIVSDFTMLDNCCFVC